MPTSKFITMNTDSVLIDLKEIYKQKNLPDFANEFVQDGIIDPALFAAEDKRILFIAKEHNLLQEKHYINSTYSYSDWWNMHVHLQFSHRIVEWAYGIQKGFPLLSDQQLSYEEKHIALRSIAFINVKKTAGTANANSGVILEYINQTRDLLHRQIREIAPTHIVTCFRYDHYPQQLFEIEMQRTTANTFSYGYWDDISVVNFYHPSSRKSKKFLYEQLSQAFGCVDKAKKNG